MGYDLYLILSKVLQQSSDRHLGLPRFATRAEEGKRSYALPRYALRVRDHFAYSGVDYKLPALSLDTHPREQDNDREHREEV